MKDTAEVPKTFEEVARLEGGGKFHCCTLLANGKVVMVPYNYPATVLFDPVAKTFEEVGRLEGGRKFHCCTLLANGKVVMVPLNYAATLLFDPIAKTFEEVGRWLACIPVRRKCIAKGRHSVSQGVVSRQTAGARCHIFEVFLFEICLVLAITFAVA